MSLGYLIPRYIINVIPIAKKVPFGSDFPGSLRLPLIPTPASIPHTAGKNVVKAAQNPISGKASPKFMLFVNGDTELEAGNNKGEIKIEPTDTTRTIKMIICILTTKFAPITRPQVENCQPFWEVVQAASDPPAELQSRQVAAQ